MGGFPGSEMDAGHDTAGRTRCQAKRRTVDIPYLPPTKTERKSVAKSGPVAYRTSDEGKVGHSNSIQEMSAGSDRGATVVSDENFVVVATFPDLTTAHLARGLLETAGIRCFVSEENAGSLFTPTLGWVKVHVAEENRLRALVVLEAQMSEGDEDRTEPSQEITTAQDSLTTGEEITPPHDEDEVEAQIRRTDLAHEELVTTTADELNERSQNAEQALLCSIIGVLFCPVVPYTIYLLVLVTFADEPLAPRSRWRFWTAVGLTLCWLPILWLVWSNT